MREDVLGNLVILIPFHSVEYFLDYGIVDFSILLVEMLQNLCFWDQTSTVEVYEFKFVG